MPQAQSLHIRLLGRFEILEGDRVLLDDSWPRRKASALVKLLALQPNLALHRDVVLETLWPRSDPAAASNNLRQNLHQLRVALAALGIRRALVTVAHETVALAAGVTVDLHEFIDAAHAARASRPEATAAHESALATCCGELLPGDAYEPWVEARREDVRSLRLQVLIELAQRQAAAGRSDEAERCLLEAVRLDELDEDATRGLMRVYRDAGDLAAAIRRYERLRDRLRQELDVAPSEQTESLMLSIRRQRHQEPPPPCPEIQHVMTRDGVRIAYWTIGHGPPLVIMPTLPISHIAREWQIPEIRHWYERIGCGRMLVRYDARNSGSSSRGVTDLSVAAWIADLEAVLDALSVQSFDVFASWTAGPGAITFAACHPERVRRLVLWEAHACGADLFADAGTQVAAKAIEQDWFMYCHLAAMSESGWTERDCTPALAQLYLDASTPDDATALLGAAASNDATGHLAAVRAPTLVMHRRETKVLDVSLCQAIVDGIPAARLMILEGSAGAPYLGDSDAMLVEVERFLDEPSIGSGRAAPDARGLPTVASPTP
jgi:DNA-binding SARP family transcriptional activator/pimeloyl-ACP methyl ester carboxylesterase